MKVIIVLYSILVLFNGPVDSRKCYQCSCQHNWDTNIGTCSSTEFLSSCTLVEVGDQYCFMISNYDGNIEERVFEYVPRDTFQDSHFIQAVERISISGTVWLPTQISSIGYGCDWDACNKIELALYLPESFQMKISQTVLNDELIDGQLQAQTCYSCGKCINDITAILCKQVTCNTGICYIDELHNYIVTAANNCTYNFFSYCEPWSDTIPAPNVRIRATYYIDFPQEKQLEIDEVDIRCTKDYCNSIEVVEKLKQQVQTTVVLHPDFQPNRTSDTTTITTRSTTTTTTTRLPTSTTTTTRISTTTAAATTTTTTRVTTVTLPTQSSSTTTQGSTSTRLTTTTTSEAPKSTKPYLTIILYLIVSLLLL